MHAFALALTMLGSGQPQVQLDWHERYHRLMVMMQDREPGRVEEALQIVERAPRDLARNAWGLLREDFEASTKEVSRSIEELKRTKDTALYAKVQALLREVGDFHWATADKSPERTMDLIRQLAGSDTRGQRSAVRELARPNRSVSLDEDYVFRGELCGNASTTFLAWAVNRYPAVFESALETPAWPGCGSVLRHLGSPTSPDAVATMFRLCSDPHSDVRRNALWLISNLDDPRVEQIVSKSLSHRSADTRVTAIRLAGEKGITSVIPKVIALLEDRLVAVCEEAAGALGQFGKPECRAALLSRLEPNHPAYFGVIYAINDLKMREAIPQYQALFANPANGGRDLLLWGLFEMDPEGSKALVLSALEDKTEDVVRRAIALVQEAVLLEAIPLIEKLAKHSSEWIADDAIDCLKVLKRANSI